MMDLCHAKIRDLRFEVLKMNRYQIKQARTLIFEVGRSDCKNQMVVATSNGDKREVVPLEEIDCVTWDTSNDCLMRIDHQGKDNTHTHMCTYNHTSYTYASICLRC